MKKNIGEILSEYRKSKFLSLKDLSKKMNFGNEGHIYLSDIELSRKIPSKDEVINILKILNVNYDLNEIIDTLENSQIDNSIDDDIEYQEETYFKTFKKSRG
ncbi:helix-turn-helix domain-containing protein [Brachyspira murdochii]|uniref:helix-turn-helix domain-containing protein n=1 Tax=Brachyspira murdochii TaxID=84378 RepID=UPI0012F4ED02|nr:helix-turn-helix transcriptional regulator [Brachyspira murdochii]